MMVLMLKYGLAGVVSASMTNGDTQFNSNTNNSQYWQSRDRVEIVQGIMERCISITTNANSFPVSPVVWANSLGTNILTDYISDIANMQAKIDALIPYFADIRTNRADTVTSPVFATNATPVYSVITNWNKTSLFTYLGVGDGTNWTRTLGATNTHGYSSDFLFRIQLAEMYVVLMNLRFKNFDGAYTETNTLNFKTDYPGSAPVKPTWTNAIADSEIAFAAFAPANRLTFPAAAGTFGAYNSVSNYQTNIERLFQNYKTPYHATNFSKDIFGYIEFAIPLAGGGTNHVYIWDTYGDSLVTNPISLLVSATNITTNVVTTPIVGDQTLSLPVPWCDEPVTTNTGNTRGWRVHKVDFLADFYPGFTYCTNWAFTNY